MIPVGGFGFVVAFSVALCVLLFDDALQPQAAVLTVPPAAFGGYSQEGALLLL